MRLLDAKAEAVLEEDSFDDDEVDEDEEGEEEEYLQRQFESLRRPGEARVSVAAFKAWGDVREVVELSLISEADLDAALRASGLTGPDMGLAQFLAAVDAINNIPAEPVDLSGDEDELGDDEELDSEEIAAMAKVCPRIIAFNPRAV